MFLEVWKCIFCTRHSLYCKSECVNLKKLNISCVHDSALSSSRNKISKLISFLALICTQHTRPIYDEIYCLSEPVSAAFSKNICQAASYLRWSIDATEIKHRHTQGEKRSCHLVPRPVIHNAKKKETTGSCHILSKACSRRLDKSVLSIRCAEEVNQTLYPFWLHVCSSVADPDLCPPRWGGETKQLFSRTDHEPLHTLCTHFSILKVFYRCFF